MKDLLSGKKTHLTAAGMVVCGLLVLFGVVELSGEQAAAVFAVVQGLGLAALRAGLAKATESKAE